ncbi:MAG: NAD(P)/FAD-dependent oxidoreductase [SAR86 cluster bacterium]|jgi:cation diffusion facilitator CzcD-associated flavoprotein CzcO|nr:NAD(P)/FAD-dependent oxidoreductase [SAR86 cluster bacterium]
MAKEIKIIILGAGMAGILAAIKLIENGFSNIIIYEKANNLGGTWRDNTYPGLICDVPSHHYTYSFKRNPNWSTHYSTGKEIQEYFENVAIEYNLRSKIEFNKEAVKANFVNKKWLLEFNNGPKDEADILIAATGVLHHPKYPKIDGIDSFEGDIFHSSNWNHSIDLENSRVGIIGNGSTGVQILSSLAGNCWHTYHFQRTPQWMMPLINNSFTKKEKESFKDPLILEKAMGFEEYQAGVELYSQAILDMNSQEAEQLQKICLDNLNLNVMNRILREKLMPDHRALCKRLIWSSEYYPAIQKPDTSLVTEEILKITKNGIKTNKNSFSLDVIVLATGFKTNQFMRPMNIYGRHSTSLSEYWNPSPEAYLSICMPNFPNFFMLNGPNGPVGNFSLIDIAEHQMNYILQLINGIAKEEFNFIEPSKKATHSYEKDRVNAAKKTVWYLGGCSSWYLNEAGIPASWPWTYSRFTKTMEKPNLADFILT